MSTKKTSRKPPGYWDDFANLESELREYISGHGVEGVMPSQSELDSRLRYAVGRHGGITVVAKKLGLNRPDARKPEGYWLDWENLRKELLDFIVSHGENGIMPTARELQKAGRIDLSIAIS